MSLAQLVDDMAVRPESVVVHFDDNAWTAGDVQRRAGAIASALVDGAGVGSGHAVAVMLPDGAEVVFALFGVWRAGAVYVPVNPRLADVEVARIIDAVRPAAVVTTAALAHRFGSLPAVVVDDGDAAVRPGSAGDPRRHDDDIALIQFTSGTTGPPKPVLLRHSGVLELLDNVITSLRVKSGSASVATESRPPMPNLVPVSLSLWAGIYQILFALRVGAPVVIIGRFDTTRFADAVRRFGIRSTVLPPAAMAMLSDDLALKDLAPLRYVRSITAPLSPLQARRFRARFNVAVLNCYGQTEIGGEIIGWSAGDLKAHGEAKLGAVGRPHTGVSVKVMGADEEDVEVGGNGELLVRTPSLSAGYANGADLSDRMTADGWFRTGDVGRIDGDGFVWIEGRVSDMINRGGLKVFPAEIVEVLLLDPAVIDAAVVGVPDDRLGEVPWAFVVLRPGAELDREVLERSCREHMAPYKVPVRFEHVPHLPRNEIGKVLNRDLVERATALGSR